MPKTEIAYIGSAPAEETCAQLGRTRSFDRHNGLEVMTYRAAIIAVYGVPPAGVSLTGVGNDHDFGRYMDLQAHFDPDDEDACRYVEQIENGLARWIDAGFLAPVLYDGAQAREIVYSDHFDAARRVMVTLERQRISGWGSPAEAAYIAHLRTAYPREAEQVDQLLRQIATEQEVRRPADRSVTLFAPYRLTFYPAMFNEARGIHFPKGDTVDVTAHERRTGHRYIFCDLGSAPTVDDALEMCWEHMARYVIT